MEATTARATVLPCEYQIFPSLAGAEELEQLQPLSQVLKEHAEQRALPRALLCRHILVFHFTSEVNNGSMTDTQNLCPRGLRSLNWQDLHQASTSAATAAL